MGFIPLPSFLCPHSFAVIPKSVLSSGKGMRAKEWGTVETANDEILVAALPRQAFSRLCGACPLTEEEENTTETRKNTEKTEDRHTHLQSVRVRKVARCPIILKNRIHLNRRCQCRRKWDRCGTNRPARAAYRRRAFFRRVSFRGLLR